jgi:ribosome maturation factor RimP
MRFFFVNAACETLDPEMPHAIDVITRDVNRLIEPVLDEMGFELVDTEYLSEHGKWVLRIYADGEGGITVDDCAKISKEISALIEASDIFQHEYVLEVSSPGLNRPLKRERDFQQVVGKKIKVKMLNPVQDQKNFTGYLKAYKNGVLYIEMKDKQVPLPRQEVKKANLVYEFEN